MRFHLDEHVDHGVARGLRARGINVTTTGEAGLLGADDRDHLEYALRERRVIYTNDADFLRLAQQGQEHAGLIYTAPGFLSLLQGSLTEDGIPRYADAFKGEQELDIGAAQQEINDIELEMVKTRPQTVAYLKDLGYGT